MLLWNKISHKAGGHNAHVSHPFIRKDKFVRGTCIRKCFWKLIFCKPQVGRTFTTSVRGSFGRKIRPQEVVKATQEQICAIALE